MDNGFLDDAGDAHQVKWGKLPAVDRGRASAPRGANLG
jgi:hypothetical protein